MRKMTWLIFLLGTLVVACSPRRTPPLTIATAANMQFAMGDITQAFTEQTGILCETVVSSSGKLTAQIRAGAPFDVFVSADMTYPTALYEDGLTTAEPKVYAYGQLVLWSRIDKLEPSIEALTQEDVNHIALANPKTAPYGLAAEEVLKHYDIYDQVAEKLVFGESIAQVNQFVSSGAAEIGFTAQAAVLSTEMKGKGDWQAVDTTAYAPIAQGAVILKHSEQSPNNAQRFYAFLFSEAGREILAKFGYVTNQ